MKAHYEGFNFSPNATVVRSPGNNEYGSKRSSDPNALYGSGSSQANGFGMTSFSTEKTASFNISGFYVAIFKSFRPHSCAYAIGLVATVVVCG
ncbi:hypothetical protein V1505DRAFT_379375 [Lipomyces doorenjongii]